MPPQLPRSPPLLEPVPSFTSLRRRRSEVGCGRRSLGTPPLAELGFTVVCDIRVCRLASCPWLVVWTKAKGASAEGCGKWGCPGVRSCLAAIQVWVAKVNSLKRVSCGGNH